jgi:methylmalonyl-CoA mutase N-terminal domain/subunit
VARRIWAKEMKKRGAEDPRSLKMRFHTQTAGCTLTAQQPENNIIRTTLQALSAVLGGTQSLHTNSKDEALCLPTEEAVTTALRTQQIIAHESGAADTIDPLAGSYYIEWLTTKMEDECYNYFKRIEDLGGVIPGIKKGFFQKEIAKAAYRYQKEIEAEKRLIAGVNAFKLPGDDAIRIPVLKIDLEVEQAQHQRLEKLRAERDNTQVQELLQKLEEMANKEGENLMPYIIDCALA